MSRVGRRLGESSNGTLGRSRAIWKNVRVVPTLNPTRIDDGDAKSARNEARWTPNADLTAVHSRRHSKVSKRPMRMAWWVQREGGSNRGVVLGEDEESRVESGLRCCASRRDSRAPPMVLSLPRPGEKVDPALRSSIGIWTARAFVAGSARPGSTTGGRTLRDDLGARGRLTRLETLRGMFDESRACYYRCWNMVGRDGKWKKRSAEEKTWPLGLEIGHGRDWTRALALSPSGNFFRDLKMSDTKAFTFEELKALSVRGPSLWSRGVFTDVLLAAGQEEPPPPDPRQGYASQACTPPSACPAPDPLCGAVYAIAKFLDEVRSSLLAPGPVAAQRAHPPLPLPSAPPPFRPPAPRPTLDPRCSTLVEKTFSSRRVCRARYTSSARTALGTDPRPFSRSWQGRD